MVELQPDIQAIRSFKQAGVDAMWVENDNGVLTVYALGAAPSSENHNLVNITVKIYSDKNHQKMLNLGGEGLTRNRTSINLVSKFLLSNYLLIAKVKTGT